MTGRTKLEVLRRVAETLVAPGTRVSYAQYGEDIILDFLCGYPTDGFYVDVGSNDATFASNTYHFYRKGWKGIAIDANRVFERRFRRLRPRDQFVHACVSDLEQLVDFHIFAAPGLSSISGKKLYDNDEHYTLKSVEKIRTRTLNDILNQCAAPEKFSFLSVDVEGHDEAVLRSIDLARYQPSVILVEANGTDFEVGRASESWPATHLAAHGYELAAVNWSNLFFRKTKMSS